MAVTVEGEALNVTCADSDPGVVGFAYRVEHTYGFSPVGDDSAVADLAVAVVSPAVDVAVGADGEVVRLACVDFSEAYSSWRFDAYRQGAVGVGAVAELPSIVPTPGVSVAVVSEGENVCVACFDLCKAFYSGWWGDGGVVAVYVSGAFGGA
ncbi:hypothetical protein KIM372_14880 [Bombiscardovia nodaiensis]|uniref:Uncharacterized protein n=1 Tax=Bombiscardovia nodaiensis TaxID=2932181 RepID=A0ABM8B9L1_9BIFI|nr:hypothetical protein KIM372_14880 [Bombiscardovia nodaiensis]